MADKQDLVDLDGGGSWGKDGVDLRFPFKLKGVEYRRFDFRVPTGRDIDSYYKKQETGLRELAMSLAEVDDVVMDAMHGSDYARALAQVGKYVAGSL